MYEEKNWGIEGIRMKAIMWDISGFTVPYAKPGKIIFFFLVSDKTISFILGKSIGFSLLLLCSLSISCLFLQPQLIVRSLARTDSYARILTLLAIAHLLVGWVRSCRRLRLFRSVERSICEEKLHNVVCAFPGLFPSVLSSELINPKPWFFSFEIQDFT